MSSSSPPPQSHSDPSAAADESSERLARWKAKWDERSLGWHEDHVHEAIVKYGDRIIPGWSNLAVKQEHETTTTTGVCDAASTCNGRTESNNSGARLFFPLCGKTLDMAATASHPVVAQVVGVDGIRTALDEFSKEHPELNIREDEEKAEQMSDLQAPTSENSANVAPRTSKYDRLVGNKILLLKGDYFGLDETVTDGRFDAVFDRASLVAIDPKLRSDYVQVMKNVIKPGGKILLVVIERMSGNDEEDRTAGPPYTVPEADVRALYETQDWVKSVTLLEEKEPEGDRKMRSVYYLVEAVSS